MSFENSMENSKKILNENDVEFETMKSGGPGGQNVNKRSTAARLRTSIENLSISDEDKKLVEDHLPPRYLTKDNQIIVENSEGRSQEENKDNALRIANEEIEKAIKRGKDQKAQEEHKRRARARQQKGGGGGGEENIKEKQKRKYRSETTEDLLKRAIEENPDLKDGLSDD